MKRINNKKDLESLKNEIIKKKKSKEERSIYLCAGGGCIASGAMELKSALDECIKREGLNTEIVETGCLGPCAKGPVIVIKPENIMYENLTGEDAEDIITEHIKNGNVVSSLTHKSAIDKEEITQKDDIDFFKNQVKIVLRNCGEIDPLDLKEYIGRNGYGALAKALSEMSGEQVIEEIKQSGLRGRGGAGFPTWMKWNFTLTAKGEQKYVLCNADEGDPGAFMDRSVLEGDPHSLIEGMAIAAYAVGADRGYVYVRAEYPLAVSRLSKAIDQAREAGFLAKNILGTNFTFDLEIRMGSGAFVCGEETALMNSIEGKRGEPRPRPPFPAQKGLWGMPSLLNNVETYANVAAIIFNGADWYSSYGTEESKGTKVFALAGAVNNTGLVEVPIGTPLGELIYDIGGGIKGGKNFKAAQIGGPSGGCIPKGYLNVPLDYSSLSELGAIMGSGGLIVMDDDTCMVDVARFFLEFVQEESCGKCVPCRVGTKRMLEILDRICSGQGQMEDIDKLIELGNEIKETSLCGLGQTAPNPVLSTIRHFRHEYEEHIRDKHCEAGICPSLVRAPCQSACPAGVDVPGFVSLIGEQRYAEALKLHRERNPFAAVCARVCFHTCEDKCRRASLDESVSIRGLKRFMVDQEVIIQRPEVMDNPENSKRKIAIIGAGPAGLSCGYFLARLGYNPVVFEAESRPGGMLVQTIPAYRLPRETLAREIRMIESMGVKIETNKKLGTDFTLQNLKDDGYEAVFIGIGAPGAMNMGLVGEEGPDVVQAVDFLKEYNIRGSVPVGKNVVVVGGGNAAVDAARSALRLGAEKVRILYRRSQEQMPAYAEEIEEAIHEGVELLTLTQPIEIIRGEDNHVTGLKCMDMELGEFDRSGRRRPTETSDSSNILETDQIIIAIGQRVNSKSVLPNMHGICDNKNYIVADPLTYQTPAEWVFAGGDAVSGPSSVVSAIAAGEKAAVGIDKYLTGESHAFWRKEAILDTNFDPDADPVPYQREKMLSIDVDRRRYNFDEVEKSWCESVAIRQANRCLRCDYGKTVVDKEKIDA
jgi:NADH-quinone oxidoreductase subunit F